MFSKINFATCLTCDTIQSK